MADEENSQTSAKLAFYPPNPSGSDLDLRGLNDEEQQRIRQVIQRDKVCLFKFYHRYFEFF